MATPGVDDAAAASAGDRSALLLSQLRALLQSRSSDGGVSSDELIGLFAGSIGDSEADKLVFRQMLRSIARLEGKKKNAKWVLKEEFE